MRSGGLQVGRGNVGQPQYEGNHHQRQNAQHAIGIRDRQHQCLLADDSHQLSGLRGKRNGVAYQRGVVQQHFRVEPLPHGHELPNHRAPEYRPQGAQRVDVPRHIRAFAGVYDTGTQEQQRDDSHGLAKGLQRLRHHELVTVPVGSQLRAGETRQGDQQQAACEHESGIDPFPV